MNPWLGLMLVLVVLGGLIGSLRWAAKRWEIHPEWSRKAVHVLMGLICCSFPLIFDSLWPVVLLSFLATAALLALRLIPSWQQGLGSVLGSVERKSWGELYFPMAVALTFWLSYGEPLLFVIPVLTLSLADTAGALVGLRYGLSRYETDEGQKSAEGSLAVFTSAFLVVHVPLLLFSSVGRAECLMIALMAAVLIMLLEAIAWRGLDNLIIPLGLFLLLEIYMPMSAMELLLRLLVLLVLVGIALIAKHRTTLGECATLAAALSAYAVWAFGGWHWLVGAMTLYIIYLLLPKQPAELPLRQNLHAVTRVMAGGFLWLIAHEQTKAPIFFGLFLATMACHTAHIIASRLWTIEAGYKKARVCIKAGALSWLAFGTLFFVMPSPLTGATFGVGLLLLFTLCLGASLYLFFRFRLATMSDENSTSRWITETFIAPACSLFLLLSKAS